MKGNLLKKIGAVATTVAMIASVSVTGFAAGVVYNTGADGAQDITGKPIMATETTTDGIYEVKIPYVSEVNNTIGVTMLAYADANHTNLTDDDKSYEEGMKIVGIEQFNAGDTTNKIGVDGTGTFTFLVDTNALADGKEEWNATDKTGVIRMNKGERGVVLISGDAATSATGYLFQVGKAAATVKVDKGGSPVTEILEEKGWTGAGADYIKDIITTGSYKVKLGDAVADAAKVTVEAKGAEYDDTNWQAQTVVYTVSFNDDSFDITPAEIKVTYRTKAWGENITATYEHTIYADPTVQTNMDDVTEKVKHELKDKTVTLTDGTYNYNYNYALTADDIATIETPSGAEWAEDGEYSYAMTIKAKTIKVDEENNLTIPDVTATIHVKIQADTRCEATSAKAFKDSAEVTESTYPMTKGDTAQKVLEYAQKLADSFKLYDGKGNEVAGTATWTLMKGDAEATLTEPLVDAAEYTAVATVVPAEEDGEDKWKETPQTVEIDITVSAKPAYNLGDVWGPEEKPDGVVNVYDLRRIFWNNNRIPGYVYDKEVDPNGFAAADVWGPEEKPDGVVNVYDLRRIFWNNNRIPGYVYPNYNQQ